MRSKVAKAAVASMAETFCLAWERDARGMGAELEDWAIEHGAPVPTAELVWWWDGGAGVGAGIAMTTTLLPW